MLAFGFTSMDCQLLTVVTLHHLTCSEYLILLSEQS